MKILLCGASDTAKAVKAFNGLMNLYGFESNTYINGTIGAQNFASWGENSSQAVERADIVVFVLKMVVGRITWEVEFEKARQLGKPYIILCDDELMAHYIRYKTDTKIRVDKKHPLSKGAAHLDYLMSIEATINTFDGTESSTFRDVLQWQINTLLESALKKLAEFNRSKPLLAKIKNRNYKELIFESLEKTHIEYYENLLFDVFQEKEVRKRVLYFFTIHKRLREEDILELLNDSEQGLVRAVIDQLPLLLTPEMNKERIIAELTQVILSSSDTGAIRRAIGTILQTDFRFGIKYLLHLFPASDIGTPRRILTWIDENFDYGIEEHLNDEQVSTDFSRLFEACRTFNEKQNTLSKLAERIQTRINSKKGDAIN